MTLQAREPAPRSPRRTRAEQAEFHERVVQTSLQLFAEGGPEALTMRHLAAVVGVPPMSLYRYFPTRAQLMRRVWDDILDKACTRAMQALRRGRPPLENLLAVIDGFVGYWLEHRDHFQVLFMLREDAAPLSDEAHDDADAHTPAPLLARQLEALFDACVADADLTLPQRRQQLELLSFQVLGFLFGTLGVPAFGWRRFGELKATLLAGVAQQVHACTAGVRR